MQIFQRICQHIKLKSISQRMLIEKKITCSLFDFRLIFQMKLTQLNFAINTCNSFRHEHFLFNKNRNSKKIWYFPWKSAIICPFSVGYLYCASSRHVMSQLNSIELIDRDNSSASPFPIYFALVPRLELSHRQFYEEKNFQNCIIEKL